MPRPKEREFTITHCFSMEKWLKDELVLEASEEGISMSRLVERILLDYFERKSKERKKNVAVADPIADPPSSTNTAKEKEENDPLVELELEELDQSVERYEKEIADFESYKKTTVKIPKWFTKEEAQSAFQKREAEIKIWKQNLTEEWYGLKKEYEKLRKKMPKAKAVEISKKLASMKKKLNAL